MDWLSNGISFLALIVAGFSALYTWRETRRQRAARVEEQVRDIAFAALRPLEYAENSAQLAYEFEEPPAIFMEHGTNGLHALAPRLRIAEDRDLVSELADAIDTVGAHWVDTITAWKWWDKARQDPEHEGLWRSGQDVDEAFAVFDSRRGEFIKRSTQLREKLQVIIDRVNARHR
ncbi:hypothetical protein [Curtobacterium sp. VKM Ac-2887]|uniref:hypothetical protein n=1 Tax=Curtobacterium sp. VKM Ac-2887 TaxID=2783819 RepID=UPI00188D88B6|nr:hypothetical protein [Curtobacterium sp. VKM Ac-2887]MBF4588369.1 hypothetical protein [Curtobacterium sp. VKM Ac-2887]